MDLCSSFSLNTLRSALWALPKHQQTLNMPGLTEKKKHYIHKVWISPSLPLEDFSPTDPLHTSKVTRHPGYAESSK